jgi:cytochrome c-type biogenesis protein CcmH
MLVFWIAAGLLSAAAILVVLARAGRPDAPAAEAPEMAVYRRHLTELDEQRARGLLDDDGYAAARAEAGRRLLAASKTAPAAAPVRDPRRDQTLVLGVIVAAVLTAAGVYLAVGSPEMRDQPYRARLQGWLGSNPMTLKPAEIAAVWKEISAKRPNDPQVWRNLGHAYADADDAADAIEAYEKAIALDPNSGEAWSGLGEGLVALNDGAVTPEAQHDFAQALKLDPTLPGPAFRLGQAAIQAGHKQEGLAEWRALAKAWPEGDPHRTVLEAKIAEVEKGADVAAAPPDQQDMVRAMVGGLAVRLEKQPDDPEGWALLVKSYGVLHDAKAQSAALAKARTIFRNRPTDLAKVEAAAH